MALIDISAGPRTRYAGWLISQAGWPAALGAGLLVFALAFHVGGLLPAPRDLQQSR